MSEASRITAPPSPPNAMRYSPFVTRTRRAVEDTPGQLDHSVRRAIVNGDGAGIPPDLVAYVAMVRERAHAIVDADVESLKRAGYTEDQIFEATAAAALGAALHRLDRGMAALRGITS